MKNDSIEIVNHFLNSENEEMGFIDDLLSNTKRSEKKPKKIYSWCVDNPTTAVEKSSEEPISNTAIHIPTSSINEQISATSSISENVETSMNEPRLTDLLSTIMENTISSSQKEVPISSIVKAIRSSVAENSTNLTFSSPTSSNASYTYSKSKGRGTQLGSAFRLEGLIEREESTSDIEILSEGPTTGK